MLLSTRPSFEPLNTVKEGIVRRIGQVSKFTGAHTKHYRVQIRTPTLRLLQGYICTSSAPLIKLARVPNVPVCADTYGGVCQRLCQRRGSAGLGA